MVIFCLVFLLVFFLRKVVSMFWSMVIVLGIDSLIGLCVKVLFFIGVLVLLMWWLSEVIVGVIFKVFLLLYGFKVESSVDVFEFLCFRIGLVFFFLILIRIFCVVLSFDLLLCWCVLLVLFVMNWEVYCIVLLLDMLVCGLIGGKWIIVVFLFVGVVFVGVVGGWGVIDGLGVIDGFGVGFCLEVLKVFMVYLLVLRFFKILRKFLSLLVVLKVRLKYRMFCLKWRERVRLFEIKFWYLVMVNWMNSLFLVNIM